MPKVHLVRDLHEAAMFMEKPGAQKALIYNPSMQFRGDFQGL